MTPTASATVNLRGERGVVLIALMLTTALVAMDATVLATAVPSVVADLGAFDQFPWLFSVYLLAQAVSVPIYAKFADMVGRRPVILIGLALFLLGSLLCGIAPGMTSLIVFRAVQGLGAGAIAPMAQTIIGDIYTVVERARVQGYIASVWAIASVAGPALGGLFSQFLTWRLIFLINVPLCLLAGWMLWRKYRESITRTRHRVDYAGAVTLTVGLTAVILGVLEGGTAWAWTSWQSVTAFGVGAAALVAFALIERRAAEPIIDLSLLGRRVILTAVLISLAIGGLLTGVTSFAPTYLENAIGTPPLIAGLAVAAVTLGWPVSASTAGVLYGRWGFRPTAVLGAAIALGGAGVLVLIAPWPNPWAVASAAFVIGLGLGWVNSPALISSQSSVPWKSRGVVTGLNAFARTAGSAVGVAIFGAIANSIIATGGGVAGSETIIPASQAVFLCATIVAGLLVVATLSMPKLRVEDLSH